MRVLFTTQSESLRMFDALRQAMSRDQEIERAGFTVADALFYESWIRETPRFESAGHVILKEWEVTSPKARAAPPDLDLLARYERELGGESGLFGAIVADRRLFMGPDCTYTQDYRRRFTDDELLRILQNAVTGVERLFDELRPDALVGFICVSILEYVAYLFARRRGLRILNLRPTRIGDRVTFGSILNDPAPEFVAAMRRARESASPEWEPEAREYVRRVREEHGRYEGVVAPSAKPALKVNAARRSPLETASRVAQTYRRYRSSDARDDNHVPDPVRALYFAAVANPLQARRVERLLANEYVTPETLRGRRFAFYPMHTEPEVSLLLYGRPFLNQIEIIRQIAISLPVDMVLVVKEHPWMVGKRSVASYRKLLSIPRVRLARPDIEARALVADAALVAVITGSVALEAAIIGRPVITFGDCPYNALPPSMVERCRDLRALPALVRRMLECYATDDGALAAYVQATFATSVSVNLYSGLLKKRDVHAERAAAYDEEIGKLASYATRCLSASPPPTTPASAAW